MPSESGTIAVASGSDLRLGGTVTFDVTFTPQNLDQKKLGVRVQIMAYQGESLVYADAAHYDQPFLLGGGSSPWLTAGGAAHCLVTLYYFKYQGQSQEFVPLGTCEFDAAA